MQCSSVVTLVVVLFCFTVYAVLQDWFDLFDLDGNKHLALSELNDLSYVLYNSHFKDNDEAMALMKKYDSDQDKSISFGEFLVLFVIKLLPMETTALIVMFHNIDTDHNKYISKQELMRILHKHEIEIEMVEIEMRMKVIDEDNDGMLSLKEFCLLFRKNDLLSKPLLE